MKNTVLYIFLVTEIKIRILKFLPTLRCFPKSYNIGHFFQSHFPLSLDKENIHISVLKRLQDSIIFLRMVYFCYEDEKIEYTF